MTSINFVLFASGFIRVCNLRVNKTINTFSSQIFYVHLHYSRFLCITGLMLLCYSADISVICAANVAGFVPVEERMVCPCINHSHRSER